MAAGDTTPGVRIDAETVKADGLFAALHAAGAGAYYGPVSGYTGDKPAVFFLKPNARDPDPPLSARSIQHVCSPPHTFTEEGDGTLTIAPSISDRKHDGHGGLLNESDGWHGYLERGVWREV